MARTMGKYFLAIKPYEQESQRITELKRQLLESFGLKYALKSPPHITLKMPFVHNVLKEKELIKSLQAFVSKEQPFLLSLRGVGSFGSRVAFIKVKYPPDLKSFQQRLIIFCKKNLKKKLELSDTNYHPHLTVAFKDFKKGQFEPVMDFIRKASIDARFQVDQITLLKKVNGIWVPIADMKMSD